MQEPAYLGLNSSLTIPSGDHPFTVCDRRRFHCPKAASPQHTLPGLGGPGWVEEKWVSSVAMVTAAVPCQPSHLTTNLTHELLCPAHKDGGQENGIGDWSMYECVCMFELTQTLARAGVHASVKGAHRSR